MIASLLGLAGSDDMDDIRLALAAIGATLGQLDDSLDDIAASARRIASALERLAPPRRASSARGNTMTRDAIDYVIMALLALVAACVVVILLCLTAWIVREAFADTPAARVCHAIIRDGHIVAFSPGQACDEQRHIFEDALLTQQAKP